MVIATQADHGGPAWMFIPWGVFATVIGTLLATNFRGFVDRFTSDARAGSGWLRKVPPWRFLPEPPRAFDLGLARVIGTIFAVVGPIVLIAGIVRTVKHPHVTLPHLHPRFDAFTLMMAAAMVGVAIFSFMRSEGNPMTRAWRRNAAGRLGVVITAVAMLVTIVGVAFWMSPVFLAGWSIGVVGVIVIIATDLTRPED